MPCGGEDIDKFAGNIRLTKANGNEENSSPYESELIYKDDDGAICRYLNWCESVNVPYLQKSSKMLLCVLDWLIIVYIRGLNKH